MHYSSASFFWLILFIAGFPQLAETVYSPSLPDIAHALHTSESMAEYTLTIYLFGFALGALFWGSFSDKIGRKPCVIGGIILFILGCIGCYFSPSLFFLMVSRFIQAFGGSIGSILGQAICRDVFHGPALSKIYASVGSALGIFPAIGPLIGNRVTDYFGWRGIFVFLMLSGLLLLFFVIFTLPETHSRKGKHTISMRKLMITLLKDRHVVGCGLIVAACNGIYFSYFSEGPFYLMNILGMQPHYYSASFIILASATIAGGLYTRKLHATHDAKAIVDRGIKFLLLACVFSSSCVLWHSFIQNFSFSWLIIITLIAQIVIMFSHCMLTSTLLGLSLSGYKEHIGMASSLFGFAYYILISLFTFGMGFYHNSTLLPMPLYFLSISIFMFFVRKSML